MSKSAIIENGGSTFIEEKKVKAVNLTNNDAEIDESVAEPKQSSENASNSYSNCSNSGSSGHMMSSGCGGSGRGSDNDDNNCIVMNRDCKLLVEGEYFKHLQKDISFNAQQDEALVNHKVTKDEQSKLVANQPII